MNKIICTIGAPLVSVAKIIGTTLAVLFVCGIFLGILTFVGNLCNIPSHWLTIVVKYIDILFISIFGGVFLTAIGIFWYKDSVKNYKKCREFWGE